ncbi:MAG: hypothetical protein A2Y45_04960 [Tenericutes bacterium GWC2_34_14]|nr:MAG: hypothetical protein A2Z84_03315 [Tenericutes bacterium GWA2_35_7]OHE29147.1 MAG: hypothetical protein A2Y45_04960 [Tenericutes bacterium GWC2_34_14]OHE34107.1 MAG: hypothetical protein A2012_05615 [Tenericutes bacterium GWE2_34_108]OHE35437.1 MAG: hypothetical protein A2Y46_04960 [Tenericutes bacterium GWF1_35_14]OHE38417.1 MAG: hypothetical protein A2Y44_07785 [Tenericutes bacterium GWF2_35_184]OHE43057.1 MAG: hypothetical protein A2221_05355 [Tenericutes bacterium RIFOXYA2_FULL_36_3
MSVLKVYQTCLDKGLTIAFAESMTGGGACHEMVLMPGASKVVLGGMIVYQTELKQSWLNIPSELIETYGVVSEMVSQKMAYQISQKTGSSIGVGITGNAGPTVQDGHAGLTCYISIWYQNNFDDIKLVFQDLTREEAIELTIETLYQKLAEILSF